MTPDAGDEVEQRLARLEATEQRLVRAIELLEQHARPHTKMFVNNAGTGPARVTAVRVTVDRVPVKTWNDVQNKAGFRDGALLNRSGLSHRVLPADKQAVIIKPSDNEQSRNKFRDLLPGGTHAVDIAVCYCSVLDECWATGIDDNDNEPRDCPIAESERFKE